MTVLHIIDPGLQTTVQDRGRFGFEHLGVARGGAADVVGYVWANRLAGNDDDLAVLENLLTGLRFSVSGDVTIGVTGADVVLVNGVARRSGNKFELSAGSEVEVRSLPGARCYVAVAGGIDVQAVLGSRSTNLIGGFGGVEGRPLRPGDEIPVGAVRATSQHDPACGPVACCAPLTQPLTIKFVPWASLNRPQPSVLATLTGNVFTVSPQSDAMGIRLAGPPIRWGDGNLPSAPMPVGGVQVTPWGSPIVLLSARGTVGGYPVAGVVITPDVWRLGQARPGDRIRFGATTLDRARSLTESAYRRLKNAGGWGSSNPTGRAR